VNTIKIIGGISDDLLCFILDFFAGIRNGGVCELFLDGMHLGGK
jgi:hypothetical protein